MRPIHVDIPVKCDAPNCGDTVRVSAAVNDEILEDIDYELIKLGWDVSNGDICPECKEKCDE